MQSVEVGQGKGRLGIAPLRSQQEKCTFLPFAVRKAVVAAQCPAGELWASVSIKEHSSTAMTADVEVRRPSARRVAFQVYSRGTRDLEGLHSSAGCTL